MARIKAHFDGRFIVPDEPVQLPAGQALLVDLETVPATNGEHVPSRAEIEERLKSLRGFIGSVKGPVLPDEALTREQIYRDDV